MQAGEQSIYLSSLANKSNYFTVIAVRDNRMTQEADILDRDLAFSSSLLGKECGRCRRAYRYNYFDKDSSSRDGFAHICPLCTRSPRLSTEEHLSRMREANDNSEAVNSQRRPNELDYLERDCIGRSLLHSSFIHK